MAHSTYLWNHLQLKTFAHLLSIFKDKTRTCQEYSQQNCFDCAKVISSFAFHHRSAFFISFELKVVKFIFECEGNKTKCLQAYFMESLFKLFYFHLINKLKKSLEKRHKQSVQNGMSCSLFSTKEYYGCVF
jgi:hypothetical protein